MTVELDLWSEINIKYEYSPPNDHGSEFLKIIKGANIEHFWLHKLSQPVVYE